MPDWLQELMGEEAPEGKEAMARPVAEAEDIPDWMVELEDLDAEEQVTTEADTSAEGIPQWLREFQVPEDQKVEPPAPDRAPAAEATPPDAEGHTGDYGPEAGAPGWLQELMVDETQPLEGQEAVPEAEEEEQVAPPPTPEPEAVSVEVEAPSEISAEVTEEAAAEVVAEVPAELAEEEVTGPPADTEMAAPLDRISMEKVVAIPESEPPADIPVPSAAPATDTEMVAPFERVEVEERIPTASRIEELLSHLKGRPRDYQKRLELADLYKAENDWHAALNQYEKLISARKMLPAVAEALESLREEQVDKARLYQLLGDVYMQNDQLDKALEMYRSARQALAKR